MQALGRQDDTGDLDAPGAPPAAGLVLRTRLFERLDQAPPQALLWVTAAPGAGKTALAAAWAESRWRPADGAAVLWYAVDETDADPLRLFATLGGFLGLAHGFGTDIPPDPTPEAFAEIAGAVRRWLAAAPPGRQAGPRLIVFDDVHLVPPEAVTIAPAARPGRGAAAGGPDPVPVAARPARPGRRAGADHRSARHRRRIPGFRARPAGRPRPDAGAVPGLPAPGRRLDARRPGRAVARPAAGRHRRSRRGRRGGPAGAAGHGVPAGGRRRRMGRAGRGRGAGAAGPPGRRRRAGLAPAGRGLAQAGRLPGGAGAGGRGGAAAAGAGPGPDGRGPAARPARRGAGRPPGCCSPPAPGTRRWSWCWTRRRRCRWPAATASCATRSSCSRPRSWPGRGRASGWPMPGCPMSRARRSGPWPRSAGRWSRRRRRWTTPWR